MFVKILQIFIESPGSGGAVCRATGSAVEYSDDEMNHTLINPLQKNMKKL
jgi:hypothetical protein